MKKTLLFLLTLCAPSLAQIVTGSNTVKVAAPQLAGRQIGAQTQYDNGQILKNLYFNGHNAGNEPWYQAEIWGIQSGGTISTTQIQSNINNNNYASITAGYWIGSTITFYTLGAAPGSDVFCTSTITGNTTAGTSPNGPVITFSPACGSAPTPGVQIFRITKTSSGSPGEWFCTGGGGCNYEQSDVCTPDCGVQALEFNATSGDVTGQLVNDQTSQDQYYSINGGTWTGAFRIKLKSGTPHAVTFTVFRGGTTLCSFTTTPTGSWVAFSSATCVNPVDAGAAAPQQITSRLTVPAGQDVLFDNFDFRKTSGGDASNTTEFRDEVVHAHQLYNRKGLIPASMMPPCRYGPESISDMADMTQDSQFTHKIITPGMNYTAPSNSEGFVPIGLKQFFDYAYTVGCNPYYIFPLTAPTGDAATYVHWLSTSGNAARFTKVHTEGGNEEWNPQFVSYSLGFNQSQASYYGDYLKRMYTLIVAMRAQAATDGITNHEIMVGIQTTTIPVTSADIQLAFPDRVLLNTYMMGEAFTDSTAPNKWNSTLIRPKSMTTNNSDPSNWLPLLTAIQGMSVCGASHTDPCKAGIYEENLHAWAGSITQAAMDGYTDGRGMAEVYIDSLLSQMEVGVTFHNQFGMVQNYLGTLVNGVTSHLFGDVFDYGGADSNFNGVEYLVRPQFTAGYLVNRFLIGPMYQGTVTSPDSCALAVGVNQVPAQSLDCERVFFSNDAGGTHHTMMVLNRAQSAAHTVTYSGAYVPPAGSTVTKCTVTGSSIQDKNEADDLDPSYNWPLTVKHSCASVTMPSSESLTAASPELYEWTTGIVPPPIRAGVVVYALPTSAYGYKPTLIPGSIRTIPVGLWCANLAVGTSASYTTSPTGTVIKSTGHNLSVGDRVWPLGFLSTPMAFAVGRAYTVTATTTNDFTIDFTDASTTTNSETAATVRKTGGTGCTGKVKWEVVETGSTASTYRLQSIDGVTDTGLVSHPVITSTAPVIRMQVGPTEPVAATSGSKAAGTFAVGSTIAWTLRATSVDDPTQFADMQMILAPSGGGYPGIKGKAFCSPGFRTVYANRHIPIVCQVFGNVNQMVNTTIEVAPGNAALSFATYPQPDFYSGSVTGLYRMKHCPAVDSSPSACAHTSIWVDTSAPPAANTDAVELGPCPGGAGPTVMGIVWDNIFDIGPTKAHHTFLDIPQTYSGNVLVRYYDEGGVGTPTTVHDQVQINPPSSGTFNDQKPAFFACGVTHAASGELPVIDANTSTANPWASQYVVGPYSFFGFAGPTGGSPLPSIDPLPWNTITVQNIKFINATQGYTYTYVADGTTQNWGEASGPRPNNAIQNFNLIGNRIHNVSDGIFDDCNAQNQGMNHCILDTFDEGNHLSNYGYPADFLAHPQYRQAFRVSSLFDLYDGAVATSEGTLWFSDRGTRSFHEYSRIAVTNPVNQASVLNAHSEIQDAYNIVNLDEFWGYQGNASCNTNNSTSIGCLTGWTLDPIAWQAAVVEEHNRTDYQIGNAIAIPNVYKSLGIEMTHSWFSYQPYGVGGYTGNEWFPENLSQNLFVDHMTLQYGAASVNTGAAQLFEDTRLGFSDAGESLVYLLQPQYYPEIWASNSLIPMALQSPQCDYACNTLNVNAHQISHFQTNMTGSFVTPAGPFNSSLTAFNTNGWALYPGVADWGPIDPITDHLSGWTTGNFINYSTYPMSLTTLIPQAGSEAIGKASSCVGDLCTYPVRYNAVDAAMSPFTLRVRPSTLGAYDNAVAPGGNGGTVVGGKTKRGGKSRTQ